MKEVLVRTLLGVLYFTGISYVAGKIYSKWG